MKFMPFVCRSIFFTSLFLQIKILIFFFVNFFDVRHTTKHIGIYSLYNKKTGILSFKSLNHDPILKIHDKHTEKN